MSRSSARLVRRPPCLGESLVRHAAHDRARIIDSSVKRRPPSSSRRRSVGPSCRAAYDRAAPAGINRTPRTRIYAPRLRLGRPPHCRRRGLASSSRRAAIVRVCITYGSLSFSSLALLVARRTLSLSPLSSLLASGTPSAFARERGRHAAAPRSRAPVSPPAPLVVSTLARGGRSPPPRD